MKKEKRKKEEAELFAMRNEQLAISNEQ